MCLGFGWVVCVCGFCISEVLPFLGFSGLDSFCGFDCSLLSGRTRCVASCLHSSVVYILGGVGVYLEVD